MSDDNTNLTVRLRALDDLTPAVLKAVGVLEQMNAKLDTVGESAHKAGDATEHFHGGLVSFAAAAHLATEAFEILHGVWEKFEGSLERSIEEAEQAEKAQNQLAGALVATGKYTPETTAAIDEYAEAISKTSGVADDLIKKHVAMGIQAGLTVQKSEEMEAASRKLAVIMGGDQDAAFRALQQSLMGHTRALAQVLPQVKEFGSAQLQTGAAIKYVSDTLSAQGELYEGSFGAGVARAKTSVNEFYKAIGLIITESPIVRAGLAAFTEGMEHLKESIKHANEWVTTHQEQIKSFGSAVLKAIEITAALAAGFVLFTTVIPAVVTAYTVLSGMVAMYGTAATVSAVASVALEASIAVLTSPITLVVAAVVGLTAAFYKWPGLFDILIGSLKTLIGVALLPVAAAIGGLVVGTGALVEVFDSKLGKSMEAAGAKLVKMSAEFVQGGVEQVKYGAAHMSAAEQIDKAADKEVDAAAKRLLASSNANKVKQETPGGYDEYETGTLAQRKALEAQMQDREKSLADFKKYYDSKIALAVSSEAEEASQVASYKAQLLAKDDNAGLMAEAESAKRKTAIHMAELKAAHDEQLLTDAEFNQATLGAANTLENNLDEIDDRRIQNNRTKATRMKDANGKFFADLEEQQKKHGKVQGAIDAVLHSEQYQAAAGAFGALASAKSTHSKTMFDISKKLAEVEAVINTASMAVKSYNALAGIPFIGPVLGAAAAAAAIAAGVIQIQNIESQQFQQAHGGLDEVPSNLDNSTFLLKGGERVVQPEANKDLTGFLAGQQGGGQAQTIQANITLQYQGTQNQGGDARGMAEAVAAELRRMSERGTLIMSKKGVY